MNILTQSLPTAVLINGREYAVNTDFRACLRVILAFEDIDLTGFEKQMILIENLYPDQPDDLVTAFIQGVKFLNRGEVDGKEKGSPRLYSFEKDAGFIFAAFRQTHGIDLETEELHWWKFLTLFMDLGADTTFCQLVGLRKRIKSGTASNDERKAASEMGEMFDIPEPVTIEERQQESEFLRLVEEGKRRANGGL